ncbi:MAG: hypothetical protein CL922_07720 [Deltaproteobacteria bacterium]|nr:hypothetical protein [Deltaproteobacteria bacterium]
MSKPSKLLLNPFVLTASGIVLLGVVSIAIIRSMAPDEKEGVESGEKSAIRPAKSSVHPSRSSGDSSSSGPRKSQGKEIQGDGKIVAVPEKSKRQEFMTTISVRARNELKGLREQYKTEFDSAESRKEFSDTLRNVTDPEERERLLRERTTAMRIARNKMDAQKGFPGRAREKRLIALMQVQNLWRMNAFVVRNASLTGEAEKFDDRLAEWAANSEDMSDEEFHASFNDLRHALNDLRGRNQGGIRPQPSVPK